VCSSDLHPTPAAIFGPQTALIAIQVGVGVNMEPLKVLTPTE
jgi:hypothetical protein